MGIRALSIWQLRINDLKACLAKTHLHCDDFRFNLRLKDPIEGFIEDRKGWHGISDDYLVTLGKECEAEHGHDATLPTLEADVSAFSRMWLGVRPASGLQITDQLSGPVELIEQLSSAVENPIRSAIREGSEVHNPLMGEWSLNSYREHSTAGKPI